MCIYDLKGLRVRGERFQFSEPLFSSGFTALNLGKSRSDRVYFNTNLLLAYHLNTNFAELFSGSRKNRFFRTSPFIAQNVGTCQNFFTYLSF